MLNALRAQTGPAAKLAAWFYGARAPEHGAITLGHRRVYILPTRLGLMFGVTLAIMLVGSINYVLSLGFMLTFVLGGLALAGMVHTVRNLARRPMRTVLGIAGNVMVVLLVIVAGAFVRGMVRSLEVTADPRNVILLGAGSEESIERSEIRHLFSCSIFCARQRTVSATHTRTRARNIDDGDLLRRECLFGQLAQAMLA